MVWLLVVASVSGFASSVYLGQMAFGSGPECIAAMERLERDYGYGGLCTPDPTAAKPLIIATTINSPAP